MSWNIDTGEGKNNYYGSNKAVLNRLARAIGYLETIKNMVEKDRHCSNVLI